MSQITIRKEVQQNPVRSEVLALISVIRPILLGLLYSSRKEYVDEAGGYDNLKLKMLPIVHNPGDGDVGICFEWAIHDAIKRNDPLIMEKIEDALKKCKVAGHDVTSLLFGAEKNGIKQIIDTANGILTDESRLLTGEQAQPIKLKKYLNTLAGAFRNRNTRPALPYSISGLWKADLFVGKTDTDRWIGSTVKINTRDLEPAKGLRVGIVPASQGKNDKVVIDPIKNLIICPVPYDGSFMEIFYMGWRVVQQFILAKGSMPREVALPNPNERQAVKELIDRLEFPVIDIVEVLSAQAQPNLFTSDEIKASLEIPKGSTEKYTDTIISPVAKST